MNTTDKIKNLSFSNSDFQMIFDALEILPRKQSMGTSIVETLETVIKGNVHPRDLQAHFDKMHQTQKAKQAEIKEEVTILQGKLGQLKRLLNNNGLLDNNSPHKQTE